jgi:hypothetical protein
MTAGKLDVHVDYHDVRFDFSDLLGGGVAGTVANLVINAMGAAIIESQREDIIEELQTLYRENVDFLF